MTDSFDGQLLKLLKAGAIGLLPTDTIYGLSGLALNEQAVQRIHKLKKRDKQKPFVVLISDTTQLRDLGIMSTDAAPALRYWPGPLTLVCEATKAPSWLHMGTKTLAVRQPDWPELRDLIGKSGPLISTSANQQGDNPSIDIKEARRLFGDQLDFYVDAGELSGEPSTIVKSVFSKLEVLRQGAVKIKP